MAAPTGQTGLLKLRWVLFDILCSEWYTKEKCPRRHKMSLIPYYLQFVSEICEGKRPLPEGFALHETDDLKKAV